jgi:ketosteroid isomerase-like protein
VTSREDVRIWVADYEAAWRTAGYDGLQALFAEEARYLRSPYAEPIIGLAAISEMWEAERKGPDEIFTIDTETVAVEGDTAVVRALVRYGDPVQQEYSDLWILRFDDSGKCSSFEEWAYWPERPWSPAVEPDEGYLS